MRLYYDPVAIALHWSIAVLILAAFALGITEDDFPKAVQASVVNLHAIMGLTILVLTLAQLFWRLGNRSPALPSTGMMMRYLTRAVHSLLYFLMVAVPVIGIPTLLYRGRGIDFGLFAIPAPLPRVPDIFNPLTEVHEITSYALVILALGHAAAALYHQFILRDGLLNRMSLRAVAQR
jgi:cytochrome b561